MKDHIASATIGFPRLRCVWLLVFVIGLVVVIVGLLGEREFSWAQYLIYVGGAFIGFASSAFWSCKM